MIHIFCCTKLHAESKYLRIKFPKKVLEMSQSLDLQKTTVTSFKKRVRSVFLCILWRRIDCRAGFNTQNCNPTGFLKNIFIKHGQTSDFVTGAEVVVNLPYSIVKRRFRSSKRLPATLIFLVINEIDQSTQRFEKEQLKYK